MIKIHLVDLIEKSIENFDAENTADLIKAEKILKAQAKMEDGVSVGDVEAVLAMYKSHGADFQEILKADSVRQIILAETSTFLDNTDLLSETETNILDAFLLEFEENIKNYFIQNFILNNWSALLSFFKYYHQIISPSNADFFKTQITNKNRTIIPLFQNYDRYPLFDKEFKFATELKYFQMQSEMDAYFFEDDVRLLNNTLIKFQKTDLKNKAYLGRVMIALYGFKTIDEDLAEVLKGNFSVGSDWINTEKNSVFILPKQKIRSVFDIISYVGPVKISKKKEQIIMLVVFALTISAILPLVLVDWRSLPVFIGGEAFFYLIFFRILSRKFEARSTSQDDFSFHRKLKKFTYNFVNLNLFLLFAFIVLLLSCGVIALAIMLPHSIAIFLIIGYRIYRKRKRSK